MAQLTELGCLKKLIAQTYDGAAVMSGELNGVQAKVKDSAPDAIFIHCLAQGGPTSALLWATFQNYSSLRASVG